VFINLKSIFLFCFILCSLCFFAANLFLTLIESGGLKSTPCHLPNRRGARWGGEVSHLAAPSAFPLSSCSGDIQLWKSDRQVDLHGFRALALSIWILPGGYPVARGRKKRKPGRYSPDEQAKALAVLAANGGNVQRTAIQLHISTSTLRRWRDRKSQTEHSVAIVQQNRDRNAELEAIAWMLLDAVPEKITVAPLNQLISGIVALEKIQSFHAEQLNGVDPINLSKMTNEQLDQLERLTAFLLSNSAGSAIPELTGASNASGTDGTPAIAPGVEPALPQRLFHHAGAGIRWTCRWLVGSPRDGR
jgi:hypothetical protein